MKKLPALLCACAPACTFLSRSTLARGNEQAFYNIVGSVSPDGPSTVMIDGKYGLIDHDGKWGVLSLSAREGREPLG